MFCKFCGKQVAPSSRVCPYCGEPQEARTGGNGFWDILGKKPVQAVSQTVAKPIETSTYAYEGPAGKETKKKGVGSRVLLLVVILGIVCTAILGVVELSTLGTLKKEMTAALQKNETAIQALEEKMNLLTEKLEDTQTLPPDVSLGNLQVAFAENGTVTVSVEESEEFSSNSSEGIQWEYKLVDADWVPVANNSIFQVTGKATIQITALEGQELDGMQMRCYAQVGGKPVFSHEAVITVPKG